MTAPPCGFPYNEEQKHNRKRGYPMFKYSSNPIFWTVAAVMLVTLADLTQVSGIQALNVLAAYFLIWWGFYLYRKSLARRWDLMLPCPDGVCVTGPGRLQAVPCLYALAQCLFSLVCLTLVQEWTVFVLVLVISLAGALITMNAVRRTGGRKPGTDKR